MALDGGGTYPVRIADVEKVYRSNGAWIYGYPRFRRSVVDKGGNNFPADYVRLNHDRCCRSSLVDHRIVDCPIAPRPQSIVGYARPIGRPDCGHPRKLHFAAILHINPD